VTWERALFSLFDDLEQQAEGLALAARDSEVAEHGRAEYATVDLEARVHGSVGHVLGCDLDGGLRLRGEVVRAGSGWCLLGAGPAGPEGEGQRAWVVNLGCVTRVVGLASRAVAPDARGVAARLGLRSVLRRLAESREVVLVVRSDGGQVRGRVGRVGADFVEMVAEPDALEVVPLRALAAIRTD